MNKKIIKTLAIGLSSMFVVLSAGCGSNGGDKKSETTAETKEYVYTAEYQNLKDVEYMQGACLKGNSLYFITNSYDEQAGTSENLINMYDVTTQENKTVPISFGEDSLNTNVISMAVNSQGDLVILTNKYEVEGEDWENAVSTYQYNLVSADAGEILVTEDITSLIQSQESDRMGAYVQYMAMDKDDNVYMLVGEERFVVLNKDGKLAFELKNSGGWVQGLGTTKEGQVVYMGTNQSDRKNAIHVIDPATKTVSKTVTNNLPNSYNSGNIIPGINAGILISGESEIFEYDIEKETATSVLAWLDSDINRDNVQFFSPLEDGRILMVMRDYSAEMSKVEVALMTKKKASELPKKEIITLGVLYNSGDINKGIIDFNKTNQTYRIEVKNYGENIEDYQEAITTFNNDIISGSSVDIFDLSSVNMKQLANKGLIEDLTPYLENDPELKREDLFESVLQAYTIDGKLLGIPNSFSIQTLVGKTSDVGEESGWTIDELMALIDTKPEGMEIFEYGSKDQVLMTCMMNNIDLFVNWETGECNLNSAEFKKVLEFANIFPAEVNYSEDDLSTPEKIQQGKLLFMNGYISSVEDFSTFETIFQEPVTAIGLPTEEGNGAFIQGNYTFAINSKSEKKDAAWEFLRSFLLPQYYENNHIWSMPTLISAFDKTNEEYTRVEYTTDEFGNQVEVSKGSMGWNNFTIERYAATDEQVAQLTKLINETTNTASYDQQMLTIINEEVVPFFQGQKTADEVMDIIQSRVQIYVDENR